VGAADVLCFCLPLWLVFVARDVVAPTVAQDVDGGGLGRLEGFFRLGDGGQRTHQTSLGECLQPDACTSAWALSFLPIYFGPGFCCFAEIARIFERSFPAYGLDDFWGGVCQIALGAMMSGSKAGLFFPTWPDMNGEYLPAVLFDASHWTADSFVHYDTNPFMPALIQFLHRNTAYLLSLMTIYFVWKLFKENIDASLRQSGWWLLGVLGIQVLLGIFTVINCKAKIPVDLGVAHQAGAVVLMSVVLWVCYLLRKK
jgi:hypothetical protein